MDSLRTISGHDEEGQAEEDEDAQDFKTIVCDFVVHDSLYHALLGAVKGFTSTLVAPVRTISGSARPVTITGHSTLTPVNEFLQGCTKDSDVLRLLGDDVGACVKDALITITLKSTRHYVAPSKEKLLWPPGSTGE